MLQEHQKNFIKFLLDTGSLTFGDFVTKSGRKTPYFVNTGVFSTGQQIQELSRYYALHIISKDLHRRANVIFGPAYKGVPLAVSTAITLNSEHGINMHYSFNRKEAKTHGDKGSFVGKKISAGDRIVIVEDVITAGTTLAEIVPVLSSLPEVKIEAMVIAVDRGEKISENSSLSELSELSALQEASLRHQIEIHPIVDIHQICSFVASEKPEVMTPELKQKIVAYMNRYTAEKCSAF
jgi:orotate phosphoribosyltransferase